ncbi:calmodulin-binding protein 25 [Ipomoea triloba]|uniref:calmodulin-binding protein 25 n=1 Tax=Ipomoea triloba TaxID=35885 RepID=UPI00125E34AD|nr:calmodulin-binding protein 25 [Ipomoea triloba]
MSDSNETTPLTPDWPPFYQQNAQPQHPIFSAATDRLSFSSAVAAAEPSSSHGLTPEGRVAKPVRRRSRASRRTPTTVFNTDASNFRAMVQQFTGGGLTMPPPPPPPFGMAFGPQHLESLNVPPRPPSYNNNNNNLHQYSLGSSSHGDHHLQAFMGRVSLNPSRGGEGSSSDQNRSQTNYML